MPRFFFDFRDERGVVQEDNDGLDLPDADAAYLEAYRAAIDIWAEARRYGRDPGLGTFAIRNGSGATVLEVPFAEALGSLDIVNPAQAHTSGRRSLQQVEATLVLTERHVADQRARLARLRAQGHDTEFAEQLLATLMQTQSLLQQRLGWSKTPEGCKVPRPLLNRLEARKPLFGPEWR
jgi:hypothetical protein